MDIANVVFVCGRPEITRSDPLLEVRNAMYSYTVERFSFSFLQSSNLARTFESARLSNLSIAGSY